MSELNRANIAEALRVAKGDIITAEGVALKEYLPDAEYRVIIAAMVRRAHLHIVEVYKEVAGDDETIKHFAPPDERLAAMLDGKE